MKKTRSTIRVLLSIIIIISNLIISENLEVQAAGTFKITTTQDSNDLGSVAIDWSSYNYADKNFKVYRSNDGGKTYETVGIDYKLVKEVRVLNIYPTWNGGTWPVNYNINFYSAIDNRNYTLPFSASIKKWMEEPNSESLNGYGKGIIKVTCVPISTFNTNPSSVLFDGNGNYKYDVIYVGTANGNAGENFSASSIRYVENWIKSGRGFIGGHDTMTDICTQYDVNYLRTLYPYFGIYDFNGEDYGGSYYHGPNSQYTDIVIQKTGLFTTYPWYVGTVGDILTVPQTHNSRERYNRGYQWLRWNNGISDSNVFLNTYNNCARIQTGDSDGLASPDEQKIIANLIFYCNQLVFNTYKTTDRAAQDIANPNTPTISFGESNIEFTATDNGSNYYYYVESYDKNNTTLSGMIDKSNTTQINVTTNVKSFRYIFDNNYSTVVTKTTGTSVAANSKCMSTAPYKTGYTYVHVAAVDGAGNIGPTATKKVGYLVSYNGNGATSGSVNSQSCAYGITHKVASNGFSKKGYIFKNWNTKANGTGITYNVEQSFKNLDSITLYAQWQPIEYKVYYDKGLTTDTSTTTIKGATRNTDIKSTGTNRPYTTATYDSDLTFANIDYLKGRVYELNFNSNKPSSISNQKIGYSANPTTVNTVTGNLPSKNIWKITGQDNDVTKNLDATMGSKLSKPNYKSTNNQSVTATAQWNNKILSNFSSPTLTGWKFIGWYDNQSGANSTAVSNTTDMIKTVNTATNTSGNTSVTTKHNVTSYTVQPNITDFKQTLYARWQRTITLTFNMNGGAYKGRKNDVILTGIYYNNADGYTFMLNNTLTDMNLPDYEQQQNSIDIYGSYNDYGANNKYTKTDINGTRYRLCGWSTNKNATEPDSEFIVFDNNHKTSYKIYDDTILYAVWEPILEVKYDINTTIDSATTNMLNASTPGTFNVKASQGSGCNYTILASSIKDKDIVVKFDSKITDIYTHVGAWNDNLNPSTNEDLLGNQKHGLNRNISTTNKYIKRDFALPNKLGTRFSYTTSINVTTYTVETIVSQDSYYYSKFKGQPKETITITGTIKLVNKYSDINGPDPRNPDDEYNGISNGIKTVIESDE